MNKASFKGQFEKSTNSVEVDFELKRELKLKFLPIKSEKKPFWNWTKALFTAPVVATIAIVFFLNFNKEVVQEVLLPQEALAQALENTFNLESFEKTFGLPDDGKFYHRTVTYNSNYEMENMGPFTIVTDLWTDGIKLRQDNLTLSGDSIYEKFISILRDPEIDQNCTLSYSKFCSSISDFNKGFLTAFLAKNEAYKPVEKESLISDLSVTPSYQENLGYVNVLQWSTEEPMESALLVNSSHVYGGYEYIGGPSEIPFSDPNNYVNLLKEGKYWHRFSIYMDTNFTADKTYLQFINHNPDYPEDFLPEGKIPFNKGEENYSMIYVFDLDSEELSPVAQEQFIEEIKKETASAIDNDKNNFYTVYRDLQWIVFLLKKDNFSQPTSVQALEKNGQKTIQVRYKLPPAFYLGDEENVLGRDFVDLYLDETQTRFLGYDIINKKNIILESNWIKDEILPDNQKSEIFEQTSWEKSIPEEYKVEPEWAKIQS